MFQVSNDTQSIELSSYSSNDELILLKGEKIERERESRNRGGIEEKLMRVNGWGKTDQVGIITPFRCRSFVLFTST